MGAKGTEDEPPSSGVASSDRGNVSTTAGSTQQRLELPQADVVDRAERARVFEALFQAPAPTEHLGRYAILGTLGSGGMGTVLEAFDRTLDRRVALKVLHEDVGDRQRLIREAQALAKLSHPNVVQVYEVQIHEVGETDGQAFIAMELVEGSSLRAWMKQEPRPDWRQCVDIFGQAARGLAAAHSQGLIHRDFKPDNVLLGADGRARVADFGLARPVRLEATESAETIDVTRSRDRITAPQPIAPLTKTGAIVGTVAYMAPEQLEGETIDARADQFSFCVALYEAVYGERPFEAKTLMERVIALRETLPEPKALRSAPRWLHRLLVRGLAVQPDDRFETMDALLRELTRPRGRPWRALLVGTGLVASIGVGSMLASESEQATPCQLDRSALGDAWNSSKREAVRSAFAAVGPASQQSADIVERALDDWSEDWVISLRSACEATRVTGIQSPALLDLRSGCLERQRREAGAIVDLLASPEGPGVRHAFELLGELPQVAVCGDPRLEQTTHPIPKEPARREAIMAAFGQIGRARGLANVGRVDEADAVVTQLQETVDRLDYLPLTLEFQYLGAQRSWWRGHIDAGVSAVHAVIRGAEIAGFDELSATIRTTLARRVAGQWGESTLQANVLSEAETAVARVGRAGDPREMDLALARAAWIQDRGDYEGALAAYRSLVETARAQGQIGRRGRAQQALGRILVELGRFEDAKQAFIEARTCFVDAHGPSSRTLARIELDLSYLEVGRGEFEAAEVHLHDLHRRYAWLLEQGSELSNLVTLAESKLAFMSNELERASEGFARVTKSGSNAVQRAEAWQALGVIRFYQGRMEESITAYKQARVQFLRAFGPEHPSVGLLDSNIGESLAALGDHHGALATFGKALDTLESTLPPEHQDLAFPYKGRAQSRLALGDRQGARGDLERALRIHVRNPGEPIERSDVEFVLARVLLAGAERQRALTLARAARARLLELGHVGRAKEIEDWMNSHN